MIRFAAVAAALVALGGCEVSTQPGDGDARHVAVFQDEQRGVTCWLYGGSNGGISCVPNWMLDPPQELEPDPEPQRIVL